MNTQKPNILVVDDTPANIIIMQKILSNLDANIITASSGNEALTMLLRMEFAVILLDVQMPDMDGFETAELISHIEEARQTPIIFVTAIEKEDSYAFKGYELGAVDYLFKPINSHVLISKVNVFLQLHEQKSALKNLLTKKQELLETIKTQSKQKDEMLSQIHIQNQKLRNYSKLYISVAVLSLLSCIAVVYNIYTKHTMAKLNDLNLAYKRFVPYEFLNLLGKGSITDVHLGDQTLKDMAVMFTDIRGYTALAENLTPQENIELTNRVFSIQLPAIYKNNGIVNKYLGDGLMALFPGGADDALACGIEMLRKLDEFSAERERQGLKPIRIGIGIDGGTLMLGTVGIEARMEQTVVADSVNVASRIEGMTKLYKATMLISENIYSKLSEPKEYNIRLMDDVTVVGREKPLSIYQVFDGESDSRKRLHQATAELFNTGVKSFREKNFSEAMSNFSKVLRIDENDYVARIYVNRIRALKNTNVSPSWSHVHVLTSK